MREYIITVADPKVWDEVWDTLTKDGLSDNYIPSRGVEVLNERPFNDFSATPAPSHTLVSTMIIP